MYTAEGPISVAVQAVADLLSNIPYFQIWTNTADPTDAAACVFLGEVGFPVASVAIAAGVITITTREPHNLIAGQTVLLQGPSIGPQSPIDIAGPITLAAVTGTSFTAATDLADLATTHPADAFISPASGPIAAVSEEEGDGALGADVIGTGGTSVLNGAVNILFENSIDPQYRNDQRSALAQARSEFGQLHMGIARTQGTGDLVCLNRIETVAGPLFIAIDTQDDGTSRFERWRALIKVTWGLTG